MVSAGQQQQQRAVFYIHRSNCLHHIAWYPVAPAAAAAAVRVFGWNKTEQLMLEIAFYFWQTNFHSKIDPFRYIYIERPPEQMTRHQSQANPTSSNGSGFYHPPPGSSLYCYSWQSTTPTTILMVIHACEYERSPSYYKNNNNSDGEP